MFTRKYEDPCEYQLKTALHKYYLVYKVPAAAQMKIRASLCTENNPTFNFLRFEFEGKDWERGAFLGERKKMDISAIREGNQGRERIKNSSKTVILLMQAGHITWKFLKVQIFFGLSPTFYRFHFSFQHLCNLDHQTFFYFHLIV